MYIKKVLLCCMLYCFIGKQHVYAQTVPVSTTSGVYFYLDQMALSYVFPWNDLIKPVSRTVIADAILAILQQKEKLSASEYKEAQFYWKQFASENKIGDTLTYLKKDPLGKWTSFYFKEDNNSLHADPVFGGGLAQYNGERVLEKNIGVSFWGTLQNKLDYFVSFNDISLDGAGVKNIPSFAPINKYVNVGGANVVDQQNYNELRVMLAYRFKNGSISVGQDRISYGRGENAQLVLSQNAPVYPYLRTQYQPFKWLQFNYMHSWLQSNILDSSATYSYGNKTYGGNHEQYQPKYYAIHSINIIPKPGIEFNIGESIVYTNQLKPGYLIPIMYFKSYDNTSNNQNILAGDNGQMFAGFSIRRWIPKTQFYGQIMIDEIRISKIFSSGNRNQLGYQLGIKKSGWLAKDNLVTGIEYTRNRPFVYANINPVINYTNHAQLLGDWMGNNADRLILYAQFKPIQRVYAKLSYEKIRKGGPGTVDDQYLKSPQPPFLFDPMFNQKNINFEIRYQWMHYIHLQLLANFITVNNPNGDEAVKSSYIKTGIYMGLY